MFSKNQNKLSETLAENFTKIKSLFAENNNNNKVSTVLESLLAQVGNLSDQSYKNIAPLNMALENINTRLDEFESKIINRLSNLTVAPAPTVEPAAEPESAPEANPYDFGNLASEPVIEPATEPEPEPEANPYDFSNLTPESQSDPDTDIEDDPYKISKETTQEFYYEPEAEETPADFDTAALLEPQTESITENFSDFISPSTEPQFDADFSQDTQVHTPIKDEDKLKQFNSELSDLADLEIMQDKSEPTKDSRPDSKTSSDFDEVDIDEFLKGRTDLKN